MTEHFDCRSETRLYLENEENELYEGIIKDQSEGTIRSLTRPKGRNRRLSRELSWNFDDFLEELENENQEKRQCYGNKNFSISSKLNLEDLSPVPPTKRAHCFGRRSFRDLSLDLSDLFDEMENEDNIISNINHEGNHAICPEELPPCSNLLLPTEDNRASGVSEESVRLSASCFVDGNIEKNGKSCSSDRETKPKQRVRFENFL
eukprot:CAMPEP_0172389922 /NCGR_PEP_ID=MMETSP1061-20121228/6702_1 /TAXON_ID=37318 /ORGANISM="Pseudo-nitzschia pungens, Strain cf. pungens" /LENGTH=204 /DNA_ID=CAMNT_0013120177 /DNA_START=151 /DNA_END=765 /DNA_ORIENTATION=-